MMPVHLFDRRNSTNILPSLGIGIVLTFMLSGCSDGGGSSKASQSSAPSLSSAALGEALFFDTNLSLNRTQSCATCHNPEHAFIDNRLDAEGKVTAFSLGDDGISLGDRNAPTAAYASQSLTFQWGVRSRFNSQQNDYEGFIGGQFWDGRAAELNDQAAGPPLNPIEMGMPDAAAVVARIQENPLYVSSMKALYGESIFDDADAAYSAMASAIAEFEQSEAFNSFDSKYDKSLRGEYLYNPLSKAAKGKALFFSQQFTNCATCHQLKPQSRKQEPFTGYEYHNIGVPRNIFDRALVSKPENFKDTGLIENPNIDTDSTLTGKFKVPTLRNIAVTGPYMHNGVFKELRTVIEFYDHFLEGSERTLNPETGELWADPETSENISETELKDGDPLSDEEIEELICFLRTLTDERYEHLIEPQGILCD